MYGIRNEMKKIIMDKIGGLVRKGGYMRIYFMVLMAIVIIFVNSLSWAEVSYTSALYKNQLPVEIKNGTFYRDGKPVFFLGWHLEELNPTRHQGGNWEGSNHRIYSGVLDVELMDEFGVNTYKTWSEGESLFLQGKIFSEKLDNETMQFYKTRQDIKRVFANQQIGKVVSAQCFTLNSSFARGLNKIKHLIPPEAFQTTSEWHDYFRFDPSNSFAREIYETDYKETTKFLLEIGMNPFIYHILNEPYYNSFGKENLLNFRKWIENYYENIDNANKQWGSHFNSIEEAIVLIQKNQAGVSKIAPGLWIEWMDFMSDTLSNHLKGFKEDILSADKRSVPKYFNVQPSGIPNLNSMSNVFDYTKLMEWFDVMVIEYGGPTYGGGQSAKENDPYATGLNMSRMEKILNMDIGRAIANGKPVFDGEMACRRVEGGIRVSSHNYDLGTSLWEEAIHGISFTIIYTWGSRSWEWKTYEEAKKSAMGESYRGCYLLNPYNYSLESLKDLKRFRNEIDRLADVVLPMPRTKGKAGIIFAHKHNWLSGLKDIENFSFVQGALMNLHIPYENSKCFA